MKFKDFYEKSYGIKIFYIWYQGIQWIARSAISIPDQLWDKTIEELEFEENNHKINCIVELVN